MYMYVFIILCVIFYFTLFFMNFFEFFFYINVYYATQEHLCSADLNEEDEDETKRTGVVDSSSDRVSGH